MARRTYLQCVNQVLKRRRQAQVSTVSERPYSSLVGDYVNDANREVENAWRWTDMRKTTTIALVPGTAIYSLPTWQDRGTVGQVLNESLSRTRIAMISDERFDQLYPADQSGDPCYARLLGYDDDGDPRIQFYPVPANAHTINVYGWVGIDLAVDAQQLLVPHLPVVLLAYASAIEELGEDDGDTLTRARDRAYRVLDDAIAADNRNQADGAASRWIPT